TVALETTSIGSLTRASYQSTVPLMRRSSGCSSCDEKATPAVQVSPFSFRRAGLPMIRAEPPPVVNVSGVAWNSEAPPPPLALIKAEHSDCSCARFGFAATFDVLPGKKAARSVRQGSNGTLANCALPLGVENSSERFGARSARL